MDNWMLNKLDYEFYLGKHFKIKLIHLLYFVAITLLSMAIRYSFRNCISADFTICLDGWLNAVKEYGGFASVKYNIGNYSPLYMYLMAIASYFPLENLGAIKAITIIFDYLCAIVAFFITYSHLKSINRSLVAYSCILFLPSILFNGAVWAQCDIIYSMFLLLSFEFGFKNRPISSSIMFGIAFSFKLQAVFFLPLLLIFWMKKKVKIRHLLLIPCVYLASILPAILAGRNALDILLIYVNQTSTYNTSLTFNLPNIYTILGDKYLEQFSSAGILFTFAILLVLFYYIFTHKKELDCETYYKIAIFVFLLIPFFLPYMHERYTFAADIFALVLFIIKPKNFGILFATQMISLLAYQSFLFGNVTISYSFAAIFYLLVLCLLGINIYRTIQRQPVMN